MPSVCSRKMTIGKVEWKSLRTMLSSLFCAVLSYTQKWTFRIRKHFLSYGSSVALVNVVTGLNVFHPVNPKTPKPLDITFCTINNVSQIAEFANISRCRPPPHTGMEYSSSRDVHHRLTDCHQFTLIWGQMVQNSSLIGGGFLELLSDFRAHIKLAFATALLCHNRSNDKI